MLHKKILVVDDEQDIRHLLCMIIESSFNIELIEAESVSQAVQILKNNFKFDLIFCDYNLGDGHAIDIYREAMKYDQNVPFFVVTGADPEHLLDYQDEIKPHPQNGHICKPFNYKGITKFLKEKLQLEYEEQISPDKNQKITYVPILAKRILNLKDLDLEVFIKLKNDKIIKILEKEKKLDSNRINEYISKGIDEFYLKEADYQNFLNNSIVALSERLENPNISTQEKAQVQAIGHQQILSGLQDMGLDPKTIEAAQKIVNSTISTIKENKSLKKILTQLLKNETYLSGHSLLICYLSSIFTLKIDWGIHQLTNKLALASFFHDIFIKDDNLAKINDLSSFQYRALNNNEKAIIKNHIPEAAELIKNFKGNTIDSEMAIMHHHELPDGSGFPKKLTYKQIPLCSTLFIVLHYLADGLIQNSLEKESFEKTISELEVRFSQGDFKKAINKIRNEIMEWKNEKE